MSKEYITIESYDLEPQSASINDLAFAADWIGQYETADEETAQQLINAIAFIQQEISKKQHRIAVNNAKRQYAQTNGIKFSQVRIKKAGA